MKVLVCDKLSERGIELLRRGGLDVVVRTSLPPSELVREIKGFHGLIIRSSTKVTAQVIEAADDLKVIGRAGIGLDNVELAAATRKGIVVMNTPGGNTVTTAEHTVALILALARQVPQATASVKAGRWEKEKFIGTELYNKTLGILGMGQVGSYVAKLAHGFGMVVLAYDPYYYHRDRAQEIGVEMVALEDILGRADIITIHTPLTPETRHLIGREAFAKMKDGVRVVNCARGGVMDEVALYEALVAGKVAGAALDVFEEEPVRSNHPLLTLDAVIYTPHLGAATVEAQENVALAVAEQVADYLVRGVIRSAVNFPSVPPELFPKVQAYLLLAEKLGLTLAQLYEGRMQRVTIEYRGEVTDLPVSAMTMAALKGLLYPVLTDSVNYVNAPLIAQERGIEVQEVKSRLAGDFSSVISLRVEDDGRVGKVAGTLYGRREPRLIEIDGFTLEVVPEGHLLVIVNRDHPGVIGNLGTLLGKNGVNISSMQLGREKPGGKALSVWGVDTPLSADMLQAVRQLPNVQSVKPITL